MKFCFQILLLLLLGFTCYSQDSAFKIRFHENNTITPRIDSIEYVDFIRIRSIGISSGPIIQSIYLPDDINRTADSIWKANEINKKQNTIRMDSLVRSMKESYPSAFYEIDSCLILNGSNRKIELCKHINDDNIKAYTSYEFKDYIRDYFVIEKTGYENWEYILFNPQTRNHKYFYYKPFFVNDSIAYSSDNYYGEGGFQIMNLLGEFYFGFASDFSRLEECYRVDKVFYLSFRSNSNQNIEPKYIKINFNKYF